MRFEEDPRRGGIGNIRRTRKAAWIAQRISQGLVVGRSKILGYYRLAAGAKGLVGREVIVHAPAWNVGETKWNILAASDLQGQVETRVGQMPDGLSRSVIRAPVPRSPRGK